MIRYCAIIIATVTINSTRKVHRQNDTIRAGRIPLQSTTRVAKPSRKIPGSWQIRRTLPLCRPLRHGPVLPWHPHPDGWSARLRGVHWSPWLISLHNLTFACSPPERTRLPDSQCALVVRPHFARAERTWILGVGRKFLPDFLNAGGGICPAPSPAQNSQDTDNPHLHAAGQVPGSNPGYSLTGWSLPIPLEPL